MGDQMIDWSVQCTFYMSHSFKNIIIKPLIHENIIYRGWKCKLFHDCINENNQKKIFHRIQGIFHRVSKGNNVQKRILFCISSLYCSTTKIKQDFPFGLSIKDFFQHRFKSVLMKKMKDRKWIKKNCDIDFRLRKPRKIAILRVSRTEIRYTIVLNLTQFGFSISGWKEQINYFHFCFCSLIIFRDRQLNRLVWFDERKERAMHWTWVRVNNISQCRLTYTL